jgi:hypothetical protein
MIENENNIHASDKKKKNQKTRGSIPIAWPWVFTDSWPETHDSYMGFYGRRPIAKDPRPSWGSLFLITFLLNYKPKNI